MKRNSINRVNLLSGVVLIIFFVVAFSNSQAEINSLISGAANKPDCNCSSIQLSDKGYPTEWLSKFEYLSPWENMGNDIRQVCSAVLDYRWEWGVQYNNRGPILRVTCNTWNLGYRVATYPEYPTEDTNPFRWGGACWFWFTSSTWDDGCSIAYHSYYTQDDNGRLRMVGGNGCDQMPTVYRRLLK